MIEHVVRRGLQHVSSGMHAINSSTDDAPAVKLPSWAVGLLVVLFLVFVLHLTAVEYMLKDVVATLSMLETPAAAITVSTPDEPASKDEKEGLLETAPTITLVHAKPITSSIRGTIRHLVSQAGCLARWRGFRIHALYSFAFSTAVNVLSAPLPARFPFHVLFVSGLAGALCANLHAAWTHKVISMPSNITFWQRVPSRSAWKVLALPAAVNAAMPQITFYIVRGLVAVIGIHSNVHDDLSGYTGAQWTSFILRFLVVVMVAISCSVFLCLPATVTLIRIEASLLPDDQDTIVPFDRTFGDKVTPKILGGTGHIGFLDAWRSFNWEARRRLIKLYVKIACIVTGIVFVFSHVIALVVFVALGSDFGKALSQAKHQGQA